MSATVAAPAASIAPQSLEMVALMTYELVSRAGACLALRAPKLPTRAS